MAGMYTHATDERLDELAREYWAHIVRIEATLEEDSSHLAYEDLAFYYNEMSTIRRIQFERKYQKEAPARLASQLLRNILGA